MWPLLRGTYLSTTSANLSICSGVTPPNGSFTRIIWRSEERRVGKECRSRCDWSSDVCSSDLDVALVEGHIPFNHIRELVHLLRRNSPERQLHADHLEIGRASCRERV